jgi:hypothetical protein
MYDPGNVGGKGPRQPMFEECESFLQDGLDAASDPHRPSEQVPTRQRPLYFAQGVLPIDGEKFQVSCRQERESAWNPTMHLTRVFPRHVRPLTPGLTT